MIHIYLLLYGSCILFSLLQLYYLRKSNRLLTKLTTDIPKVSFSDYEEYLINREKKPFNPPSLVVKESAFFNWSLNHLNRNLHKNNQIIETIRKRTILFSLFAVWSGHLAIFSGILIGTSIIFSNYFGFQLDFFSVIVFLIFLSYLEKTKSFEVISFFR